MNKSHLIKQWKKTYGEDFKRQYGGVFRKLPNNFDKKTLIDLWDKMYGEKFEKEYPGVSKLLDVNEGKTVKLTKSKLKEIVKEELLSEAMTAIHTKRDLQRALKSAFNEIYKGKVPKELHRGDTGEMLLTTEVDGRGRRVEIIPETIADAVRELK